MSKAWDALGQRFKTLCSFSSQLSAKEVASQSAGMMMHWQRGDVALKGVKICSWEMKKNRTLLMCKTQINTHTVHKLISIVLKFQVGGGGR